MPENQPLAPAVEDDFKLAEVQLVDGRALSATPGRAVSALEARQMLAGGPLANAEAARLAAAIPHADDEVDNHTARTLAGRRLEATAELAVDGGSADVSALLPGIDEAQHRNLPDIIRKSVLGIDYDESRAEPVPVVPRWLSVYDLPNYMVEGIRALGRSAFKTFSCFKRHEHLARDAGEDPLGSMRILANLQGRGPTPQRELDAMASWIRANGVPIEAGHIEFPIAIPGYSPRVILAGNETTSFLLVDEKRIDNAPVDAQYIYAWAGGRQHYLRNPQDLVKLNGPAARQVVAPAYGGRGRGVGGHPDPEGDALRNIARIGRPTLNIGEGMAKTVKHAAQKAAVKALPVATDANPEAVMAFRRAGFRPDGPQAEMRLKRAESGGRISILTRNPDFATGAFMLSVFGEDGVELHREAINDLDALEAAMPTASPTP